MAELGDLARAAAPAFAGGDAATLRDLMAASAAVRDRVAPLPEVHRRLAEAVAGAGLAPNSAGSGGAVAAVVTTDDDLGRLATALAPVGAQFAVETYGEGPT